MNSLDLLCLIVSISALVVIVAVGVDVGVSVYNEWQDLKRTAKTIEEILDERVSNEETQESYGPIQDQMNLSEFLDFWMCLSDWEKDNYIHRLTNVSL